MMGERQSSGMGRDTVGAVLGLLVAAALFPLQFLASGAYITLFPFVVGGASLLYLAISRQRNRSGIVTLSRTASMLLPALTMFALAAMVLVAGFDGRTLLFYYLAAWAGVLLIVQSLFTSKQDFHPGLVLAQVVLFGLVIRLSALYTSPGFIGIDIWTHVATWAREIEAAESLAPIATEKYYASPLYHLLVVSGSQLMAVTLRHALFLTVGLAMPLGALFVYGTAELLAERRWAVLAATVFTLSGHVTEWGIHLIPTSLGLLFFTAVLYALARILTGSNGWRDYVVVVVFSAAIILTHQISSFIMLVLLGAAVIVNVLLSLGVLARAEDAGRVSHNRAVNLTGLLVFDLGLATFTWSLTPYRGDTFLETMGNWFVSTVTSSAGFLNLAGGGGSTPAGSESSQFASVVAYMDALGFLLLLFLAIVGSLAVLRKYESTHAGLTAVVAILLMMMFVFGFPLFGIRMFVPSRWYAFLIAPIAVLVAVGARTTSARSPAAVATVLLVVFTLLFPATAVISSEATQDAPVIEDTQTRYSYTSQELAAVDTLDRVLLTNDDDAIYTDHPYNTVFKRTNDHTTRVTHVVDGNTANETVVYRDYQDSGAAFFADADGNPHQPALDRQAVCEDRDITYDNGDVSVCVRNGEGGG